MRYFDEYCEIHLESDAAPFKWVFKSGESIQIRFGVSLARHPERGYVTLEARDPQGGVSTQQIAAHEVGITENSFKLFAVILPAGSNGTGYRYRVGYRDRQGHMHASQQTRCLMVCDEALLSMQEVESVLLDVVDGNVLYGPRPTVPMSASPQNWANRLFYSLIIDRFSQSTTENRQGLGFVPYNLTSPYTSHGGTLQGIREKLTYLKDLGIGALMVSPVYVNEASGYHGYHPIHLLMVDPRLGTLQLLQDLVEEAHALDIAVILDVVVNHLADNIDWEEYGGPPGGEFKYVRGDSAAVMPFPVETRNTLLFHGPEYTDLVNQRLFGFLEDWRTEKTYVRQLLVDHLKYWLAVTDVDGFRYDSARHVGTDFWQPCVAEISRYARYLGKTDFLQIAEHAGSCHEELTAYNAANFSGFLDYPTHYTLKHALGDGDWLSGFADYFCGLLMPTSTYVQGWRNNLMFLDNQDTTRILHEFLIRHADRAKATSCLHFALACSILGPQRPAIYAGTEQEFSGALGMHQREDTGEWIGHDCHVREDMFDNPSCVWKFGPINRKVFQPYNQEHETFQLIQSLADVRRRMANIQSCDRTILISKDHGLRCVLLHDAQGTPPCLVVMNLGIQHLAETNISIPESHGQIVGLEVQAATAGGQLAWIDQTLQTQLPPFAFVLAQLDIRHRPIVNEQWHPFKEQTLVARQAEVANA